jgi:hypothetical protein
MAVPAMSLAVVGVQYPNKNKSNRQFEIAVCKPGEPVELRPEPKNISDENAVAVFSQRGVQIGYLTAERCGRIGAVIRQGREIQAVFQREAQHGAWIRVAFDGEVPIVDLNPSPFVRAPLLAEGADPETDFYPDPEWED